MSQKDLGLDTREFMIGNGKVFFTLLDSNGKATEGMRFIGNASELTANVETENYEFFGSTEPVKEKVLDIMLQQSQSWTGVIESLSKENLALFFSGEEDSTYAGGPAITGFSAVPLVAAGELESEASANGGRWYPIVSGGVHVFNLTADNAVTLSSTNTSPVELTKGTDYLIDLVSGRVFFLDSTKVQAIISAEEGVTITATADATATPVGKILTGTSAGVSVEVRFEHINQSTGTTDFVYVAPKAKISANGEASLIGDEAMGLPINIGLEKHPDHSRVLYVYDLRG